MKLALRMAAVALVALFTSFAHAQATRYTINATPFFPVSNTACNTGLCKTFQAGAKPTGSFVTSSPLPPNMPTTDILAQVTSYSFSDGVTTYSNADPDVRVFGLSVSTSASGVITGWYVLFERWLSPMPHASGSRLSVFNSQTNETTGANNLYCTMVGSSLAGVPDSCNFFFLDPDSSYAQGSTATWTSAPVPPTAKSIPTNSEWGLITLSVMVGALGLITSQRKRPVAASLAGL